MGQWTLPEVRDWSGDPSGCLGWVRGPRGGPERIADPQGGPGWVGGPSGRFGKGRGALVEVRDGKG